MAKIGRPTKRTREIEEDLLLWIAEGKTLRAFCRDRKLSPTTIYSWVTADPALSERLARARLACAWSLEDEIQEIADTPTSHRDDVQHRRLQIYAREKRLAWNDQTGRYSTRSTVAIGGAPGLPPVQLTDTERVTRIRQLLDKAAASPAKITVENVEESPS